MRYWRPVVDVEGEDGTEDAFLFVQSAVETVDDVPIPIEYRRCR